MNAKKRNPQVHLEDILASIGRIELYISEGEDNFYSDGKTQDAVIRQVSIIGEASSRLSPELRKAYSTIPWRKVIDMRNVIIHDYSETNLETIWTVATRDLPILKETVNLMLKEVRGSL
jgi:uncharacterized protein with HEPN domain